MQNQGKLDADDKYANIWSDWPKASSEFKKGVAKMYK